MLINRNYGYFSRLINITSKMRFILIIGAYFLTFLNAQAQFGLLDTTFVDSGFTTYYYPSSDETITQNIAVSNTGQIVMSGLRYKNNTANKIWLISLLPNGQLDTNFNQDGWKFISCKHCFPYSDLVFGSNGQLFLFNTIIASYNPFKTDIKVWRMDTHGNVDSIFYFDILKSDEIEKVLTQSNGDMIPIVSKRDRVGMIRIDINGKKDLSFGNNGIALADSGIFNHNYGTTVGLNDEILIGGSQYSTTGFDTGILYKFLSNGKRDTTFGLNGKILMNIDLFNDINNIGVLSDSRIVIQGFGNIDSIQKKQWVSKMMIFNNNGTVDFNFGNVGHVSLYPEYEHKELIITPDDKILLFGDTRPNGAYVERFFKTGIRDSTFGINGRAEYVYDYSSVADGTLQADGKVLMSVQMEQSNSGGNGIDTVATLVARYETGIPIGIKENELIFSDILFYPNPFIEYAALTINLKKSANINIKMININGQIISTLVNSDDFEKGKTTINIKNFGTLPNGNYFIIITSMNSEVSIPIIKTN